MKSLRRVQRARNQTARRPQRVPAVRRPQRVQEVRLHQRTQAVRRPQKIQAARRLQKAQAAHRRADMMMTMMTTMTITASMMTNNDIL